MRRFNLRRAVNHATARTMLLFLSFGLASCGEPQKYNDKNFETSAQSMGQIESQLSSEEISLFEDCVAYFMRLEMQAATGDYETPPNSLDGLTAPEIFERARTSLQSAKTAHNIAREVTISGPQYRDGIISITVFNGSKHTIADATFQVTLKTIGRNVPWYNDGFRLAIDGGLEPGERRKLSTTISGVDETTPPDAKLTVVPVQLIGPNRKLVYSSNTFTDSEAKLLRRLEASSQLRTR